MKVNIPKENILLKIDELEIFKWNDVLSPEENTSEQQRRIIDIASKEFHELLDEPMRKNFGDLKDKDWETRLDEITSIISEILDEHLIPLPTATLRAKIAIKESKMPKYDK